MDLRELIAKDLANQEKLVERYRKELKKLPKGSLYVKTNGGRHEYYRVDENTRTRKYIKKGQMNLVYSLKKRKFMELTLDRMAKNIKIEKAFLRTYKPYDYMAITKAIPIAYRLEICPKNKISELKVYADEILHETTLGFKVRSKSEAIICELLKANDIDFEYETDLILFRKDDSNIVIRPDFTFENEVTGEKIYWEHMGMLNNVDYQQKNIKKLLLYMSNDIMLGVNLFITADTMDGRIDIRSVTRTIELIKSLL